MMNKIERHKLLQKARDTYGIRNQLAVAAEECNELAIALLKFVRYEDENDGIVKTREKVLEERADVDIILNHIDSIYGFCESEIAQVAEGKLQRLKNWLEKSDKLEQSTIDREVPISDEKGCTNCFWYEHWDELEAKKACRECRNYDKRIG